MAWLLTHWRTLTLAVLLLALAGSAQELRTQHARIGQLKAEKTAMAVTVRQAEANRRTLEDAIAKVRKSLTDAKTAGDAAAADTRRVAEEAKRREARERVAYAAREQELEKRLVGMTECQQCEEAMKWLEEEAAR